MRLSQVVLVRPDSNASYNSAKNCLYCLFVITSCARGRHNVLPPGKLTFDLLTLNVLSESRVTWATSVPILVFLSLSVLDWGPTYATDRRQTSDAHHRL